MTGLFDCQPIHQSLGCYSPGGGASPRTVFIWTQLGVNGLGNAIVVSTRYTESDGTPIIGADASNVTPGACAPCTQPDVQLITAPLAAGNNVIAHTLGLVPGEVTVRNAATGALISARLVSSTPTTITLFVAVAVTSAQISLDA